MERVNTIMTDFTLADCRILRLPIIVEQSILDGLRTVFNKWSLSKRSLGHRKKLKYTAVFAALVVILSAFLASFSVGGEIVQEISENNAGSQASTITQYSANMTENPVNETKEQTTALDQDDTANDTPAPPGQAVTLPKPLGIIKWAEVINQTTWKAVANHAWTYFQPGFVCTDTGLPAAGCGFPYFTDWDLGVYVQAVIDAQTIGLIEREGQWGADSRFEKVLTFLENRTLTNDTLPFWFYQTLDGNPAQGLTNFSGAIADTGRLLVSLRNLKNYNVSLQTRIDNVVKNRVNCSFMLTELDTLKSSSNIYDYFVASGYAAFWPDKTDVATSIIDNIMSAPTIDVNGGILPMSKISCEPILHSIFDLEQHDPRIHELSKQVYLAHEGWFNATGRYRAFSEGPTIPGPFAYEWVVLPDGQKWAVHDQERSDYLISPIIYSKVAFSFLALYNTAFARDMVILLENTLPDLGSGYCDGIHEDGRNKVDITGCNTNGLVISAARYAIQSGNWP